MMLLLLVVAAMLIILVLSVEGIDELFLRIYVRVLGAHKRFVWVTNWLIVSQYLYICLNPSKKIVAL